jgi:fused signal recognition particle receptor
VSEERTSKDKARAKGFFGRLFRKGKAEEEPEPAPGAEPGSGDEQPAAPEAEPPVPPESPAEPAGETGGEEADAEAALEVQGPESSSRGGLFARLRSGLSKTREGFVRKVDRALLGRKEIDAETLEALEEVLITADLGVHTVEALIGEIQERVSRKELTSPEALREHLREAIRDILVADEGHLELGPDRPHVLMVVGVNGVGKTTTIGKIAAQFRARGHKVVLAAADTFRAAAIEQLAIWGERVGATVIRHQHGSDPAAVAFDAVEAARARRADLVIVDTAGRLHTKANLMEELKKVRRVLDKALPGAPHEVLLVLDATTGQNAVSQARTFRDATGVDSIALTKLDGTAKGGVIVAICHELGIPVKYIGIGEGVEDLRPFDARAFVDALF